MQHKFNYERLVRAALRLVAPGWGTQEKVKFRFFWCSIFFWEFQSDLKKNLRFEKNLRSHKNSEKKCRLISQKNIRFQKKSQIWKNLRSHKLSKIYRLRSLKISKIWGKYGATACIFCWVGGWVGGWYTFFRPHSGSELSIYPSYTRLRSIRSKWSQN